MTSPAIGKLKNNHLGPLRSERHCIDAVKAAIKVLDRGQKGFADALGVSPQQVSLWLSDKPHLGTTVTAERAVQIERVTRGEVTREMIRPDLFIRNGDSDGLDQG